MNKLPRIALLTVVLCGVASVANAAAILIGSIANNGQIVGINDTVTIRVSIQNIGDTAHASDWSTGGSTSAVPVLNYTTSFGPLPSSFPDFSATPLAPGDSVAFDFVRFIPFVGGADPGPYVVASMFLQFDNSSLVTFGPAYWEVVDGAAAPVPEPATFSLLGLGLAGLVAARYRRKRV